MSLSTKLATFRNVIIRLSHLVWNVSYISNYYRSYFCSCLCSSSLFDLGLNCQSKWLKLPIF